MWCNGVALVLVKVPLHFVCGLYGRRLPFGIAMGMVPVGVQVLMEMGVAVLSIPMNVLVIMLMPMRVLVAIFNH